MRTDAKWNEGGRARVAAGARAGAVLLARRSQKQLTAYNMQYIMISSRAKLFTILRENL